METRKNLLASLLSIVSLAWVLLPVWAAADWYGGSSVRSITVTSPNGSALTNNVNCTSFESECDFIVRVDLEEPLGTTCAWWDTGMVNAGPTQYYSTPDSKFVLSWLAILLSAQSSGSGIMIESNECYGDFWTPNRAAKISGIKISSE